VLEVVVGLAILLFALFFPDATALIILGIAVTLTIPDVRKRLRNRKR
jgi:hypothetical protein